MSNTENIFNREEQLENLNQIRSLMERSTRFISLSGLSGVAAGIIALIGAFAMSQYLGMSLDSLNEKRAYLQLPKDKWGMDPLTFVLLDAGLVMFFALLAGLFFTYRKAKKQGRSIWTKASRRLALHSAVPMLVGGIFCLIMLKHGHFGVVAPGMLIFYGMALYTGGMYTLNEIRWLGVCEMILGLIAAVYYGYGLLCWALGFGVLHIVYGLYMYFKYER